MRLYAGTSKQFVEDNVQNQIAGKLNRAFFDHYRFYPSEAEKRSWQNSLKSMALVIQGSNLLDHGIILEYQLPLSSKRLDCMICGRDPDRHDSAVIVELKQWEKCEESDGEYVLTWVAGGKRDVLHPSVQVGQYHQYLLDTHTAFHEGDDPVLLNACSYLHNYSLMSRDPLVEPKFSDVIASYPLFSSDDVDNLTAFLGDSLERGGGVDVMNRIETGRYRPSKKLMEHVAGVIQSKPEYILLDEQLVVYDRVRTLARKGFHSKQKSMIIVKGGPGTGKSVIAINLMADLLRDSYNAHYATGSRAFTETMRRAIGRRGAVQFKYFNSYGEADEDDIDVLIADEAHRIRFSSDHRFTPRGKRSQTPQVDELIKASQVSVFFIDDKQGCPTV